MIPERESGLPVIAQSAEHNRLRIVGKEYRTDRTLGAETQTLSSARKRMIRFLNLNLDGLTLVAPADSGADNGFSGRRVDPGVVVDGRCIGPAKRAPPPCHRRTPSAASGVTIRAIHEYQQLVLVAGKLFVRQIVQFIDVERHPATPHCRAHKSSRSEWEDSSSKRRSSPFIDA